MDKRWYLDINHFARSTPWAHSFMAAYAVWGGVVLLGVALVAGWWWSRADSDKAVVRSIWAAAGTLAAVGINQPISHAVARVRPYHVLAGVEVLVPRANDFSFTSDHATAAGAVICGLFLAGRRRLGLAALVIGLFLAFDRIYVGAHYPTDVIAGLVLGAVVVGVLLPIASFILRPAVDLVAASPLRPLVVSGRRPPRRGRDRVVLRPSPGVGRRAPGAPSAGRLQPGPAPRPTRTAPPD